MSSSAGVPAHAHVGLGHIGGTWWRFGVVEKDRIREMRGSSRYERLSDIARSNDGEGAWVGSSCIYFGSESFRPDDAVMRVGDGHLLRASTSTILEALSRPGVEFSTKEINFEIAHVYFTFRRDSGPADLHCCTLHADQSTPLIHLELNSNDIPIQLESLRVFVIQKRYKNGTN